MRLTILIFLCFHGVCWPSPYFCVYQPRSVHVKEGESVTIPCTYTYADYIKEKPQVILQWGEPIEGYCVNIKKHIADNSGNIIDEYKDRMSIVNHPDNQKSSLIIRGLKDSDGITFCCIATKDPGNHTEFTWKTFAGTSLIFADGEKISQMDELMAVPGEEMTIPCHYPLKTLGKAKQVTWHYTDDKLCDYSKNKIGVRDPTSTDNVGRYSLVNFPEDFSLRIHRVQGKEFSRYCCQVTTSNGRTIHSRYGTELIIADSSSPPPYTVTQPYNITGHRGESVTLNCSYSSYMESDVLGVNIYWRLGNLSGPYVYHPYKEMVHPGYRGRTEIRGAADLHIQGVQMSDVSMYYCFVMIRLCTGNEEYKKLIQYGEGTRLNVTGNPSAKSEEEPRNNLVTIASISAAVLLVLLCVVLVILKVTGVICKKKNVSYKMKSSDNSMKGSHASQVNTNTEQNEELERKESEKGKRMESEKDENIVYSEVNKTKLQQRNPAPYLEQEEQVVYAAVVKENSKK